MYSQKLYRAQERYHPDYEHIAGVNISCPPKFFGSQQEQTWTPRFCIEPAKPSCATMLSRFESPVSAFYAAERFMGFPQHEKSLGVAMESVFPLYRPSNESFPIGSKDVDNHVALWREISVPSVNQDHIRGTSFEFQQVKQLSRISSRSDNSTSSSSCLSTGSVLPGKTRIRWTQDLHEKFIACVNRLGGAEKATPKAILKLMDSDGLTIFHIKSHLQKYRIAKYVPDSAKGRNERRTSLNVVPQLDLKSGLQIKETLQLQLDVQRQLHQQLEIQRKLQVLIEEQGRKLRMMFDQQQKTILSSQNNASPEDDRDFQVAGKEAMQVLF